MKKAGVIFIIGSVVYDLGNIWDMLSGLGTVGAVVISLIFTFRESRPKMNAQLSIGYKYGKFYQIILTKENLSTFTLINFGYYHNFRKRTISYEIEDYTQVLNTENKILGRAFPYEFSGDNIIKLVIYDEVMSKLLNQKVRFYVKDINGKIYKTNKILMRKID